MSKRCGKTAKCHDDLLEMMQNKDISTMVLFSRDKRDNILYTQQYVDKLNARIHDLQDRIDKAIKHIKEHNLCYQSQYGDTSGFDNHLLDILRGKE